MQHSAYSRGLLAELDFLRRGLRPALTVRPVTDPAPVHVEANASQVDVRVFAPGLDPASLEVVVEDQVLRISGTRAEVAAVSEANVHLAERATGAVRRQVVLPGDADTSAIQAHYTDGVLRVQVPRRAGVNVHRITVQ